MKTTLRTLRRIVKEELEQLTLPGVTMGPRGEEAWEKAWQRLQDAGAAGRAAQQGDDEQQKAATGLEYRRAWAAFHAINDVIEDDDEETQRQYGYDPADREASRGRSGLGS